jgi:hypothetical protein
MLRVFNTNLYENEFQNPQIFQQTISHFPEHSTLARAFFIKDCPNRTHIFVHLQTTDDLFGAELTQKNVRLGAICAENRAFRTRSPSPKGFQSPKFSDSDFREVRGLGLGRPKCSG